MTTNEISSITPGTKLQFNYDVHIVTGPNPLTWSKPVTVDQITFRGAAYVGIRVSTGPTSTMSTSLGVDDKHCRLTN